LDKNNFYKNPPLRTNTNYFLQKSTDLNFEFTQSLCSLTIHPWMNSSVKKDELTSLSVLLVKLFLKACWLKFINLIFLFNLNNFI